MLGKGSLFTELLKISETPIEKDLIKELFNLLRDFYYVLDIHNECDIYI